MRMADKYDGPRRTAWDRLSGKKPRRPLRYYYLNYLWYPVRDWFAPKLNKIQLWVLSPWSWILLLSIAVATTLVDTAFFKTDRVGNEQCPVWGVEAHKNDSFHWVPELNQCLGWDPEGRPLRLDIEDGAVTPVSFAGVIPDTLGQIEADLPIMSGGP